MDGGTVRPRVSLEGRPAMFASTDAGRTWKRRAGGLPSRDAWFAVKRQGMCADAHDPVGLYFGTTSGEVWASNDEGARLDLHRLPSTAHPCRRGGVEMKDNRQRSVPTPASSAKSRPRVQRLAKC